MNRHDQKTSQAPICDFVPGYAYYDRIGQRLAETFVNWIEWLLGWRR